MDYPIQIWQWILVIASSLLLLWIAPKARTVQDFFKGSKQGKTVNIYLLTSSLVISWLFAKSITNAANLGLEFGMLGGLAYAVYYLSFVVAGLVIYKLRTQGGFKSIHQFLETRYGLASVAIFSVLIAFRLFNEVWSNTMVIGSYFGEAGSSSYYLSILVFTILTLAYSLKGGMSSSIMTDLIQMILFALVLIVVLGVIIPQTEGGISTYLQSGEWSMAMGGNLLLVAFIQSFSYPFHDPVMTDRGFITDAKTTLRSFLLAALIGMVCILLFSFVGIFGGIRGVSGQAPVEVAKLLGIPMMLLINFIMITSAASTLDSTFSSFAKLVQLDIKKEKHLSISAGRKTMVAITILGTIPVFLNPAILSATTVSGTMVLGLAPVFILWFLRPAKWAFYASVGVGLIVGLCLAFGCYPESLLFTTGKYADLLSANLLGTVACFTLFFVACLVKPNVSKSPLYD